MIKIRIYYKTPSSFVSWPLEICIHITYCWSIYASCSVSMLFKIKFHSTLKILPNNVETTSMVSYDENDNEVQDIIGKNCEIGMY